jgi:homoserine kinase
VRLTAVVPATSANLGPGFDCFGLALDLCNEVTIDTEAEPRISWEGEGADELPTDGTDMVSRAIVAAFQRRTSKRPETRFGPFSLRGVGRIPLERGLGSSSAAVVAGTALAAVLLGASGWEDPITTFAYAAELEGHPDNAAPAVYGGLTVIADGSVYRMDVHPSVHPVALVPERMRLSTEQARRALPAEVPISDAVSNVAHGALVVTALSSGDLDLLLVALHDRLHEGVRLSLLPGVRDVLEGMRHERIPVCVSGAGPSLLAFEREDHPIPDPGPGWKAVRPGVRARGVEIRKS